MYVMTAHMHAYLERCLDQVEQAVRRLLAVQPEVSLEEPVPRVLRVGLGNVEELHIRRVAAQLRLEHVCVVIEVPLIKRQAKLLSQQQGLSYGEGRLMSCSRP